jgi:quinol monooxygenase YgiN
MTQLTQRAVIHAGTVAVGGMSFALPTFIPQVNAQASTKEQTMYIAVSQVRVTPGSASQIAHRVQESLVPMLSKEPGFLGYYLVSAPDNELTTISIFQKYAAAEACLRDTLEWFTQHIITQIQGSAEFTTGQVLVHKMAQAEQDDGRSGSGEPCGTIQGADIFV